jgi:hypothetical protein
MTCKYTFTLLVVLVFDFMWPIYTTRSNFSWLNCLYPHFTNSKKIPKFASFNFNRCIPCTIGGNCWKKTLSALLLKAHMLFATNQDWIWSNILEKQFRPINLIVPNFHVTLPELRLMIKSWNSQGNDIKSNVW